MYFHVYFMKNNDKNYNITFDDTDTFYSVKVKKNFLKSMQDTEVVC